MPRGKKATHCIDCGVKLEGSNIVWIGPQSKRARCNNCQAAQRIIENRAGNLMYKYGVTVEEYNKMFEFQQGGCAICRQAQPEKNLAVDHNHETDEIRGLLCFKCNIILGHLNDDEDLLWKIAEYLKRTTWNKEKQLIYKKIGKLNSHEEKVVKLIAMSRKISTEEALKIFRNSTEVIQ